jgi:hypothetical protein
VLTIIFKEKHLLQGIYLEGRSFSYFAYALMNLLCFAVICILLVADACVVINLVRRQSDSPSQA